MKAISLLVCGLPLAIGATWNINGAMDSRLMSKDLKDYEFTLHGSEINLRYTYSDLRGDRLIFFLQIPYSSHLASEMFFHHYGDAYLLLRGQLGEPNIRIGRFDIPFGILKTLDTHFSLLPYLYSYGLGVKKDIGAAVFGYYKILTYDLAFTQGFNNLTSPRMDKPITIRLGLETEGLKAGLSILASTMMEKKIFRRLGIDIEKNINPFVLRAEIISGDKPEGKGFSLLLDFPFFFGSEGKVTYLLWTEEKTYANYGVELNRVVSFITFGVGWVGAKAKDVKNDLFLQLRLKI